MTKRVYHSWSPLEEANLQQWVDCHLELSWKARAEKYSTEVSQERSPESLRSKYSQLCKGIRRRRPVHGRQPSSYRRTAQQARYRQQRVFGGPVPIVVPTPPVLTSKGRSPKMQAMRQWVPKSTSSHQPQAHPTHQPPQLHGPGHKHPVTVSLENQVENHYHNPALLRLGDASQGRDLSA